LGEAGYQTMVASTTLLNRPGVALAALPGVHAMTDVTGFGLLGHALEIARGSGLTATLRLAELPWLAGVKELATQGVVTGASARNWASYGASVQLPSDIDDASRALLTDPQTSGGLLVACSAATVNEVMDIFRTQGFAQAAVIGELTASSGPEHVRVQ
jgi:selenide,water dikinase